MGTSVKGPRPLARTSSRMCPPRPRVLTITPESINRSHTPIAASSSPPWLSRRSRTRPRIRRAASAIPRLLAGPRSFCRRNRGCGRSRCGRGRGGRSSTSHRRCACRRAPSLPQWSRARLQRDRLLVAFVEDDDVTPGAGLAAEVVDGVGQRHALGAAVVDLQDAVAGADARL